MRWLLFFVVCLPLVASAHQLSTAYLQIGQVDDSRFQGQLQWRLYDLERRLGIDRDRNGQLTWGELQSREAAISRLLAEGVQLSRGDRPCDLSSGALSQIDRHYNQPYLVLPVQARCPDGGDLSLQYDVFFDRDASHKLLLNVSFLGSQPSASRVISRDQRRVSLPADAGFWRGFAEYVYQGVVHILIGWDHILFLLCLLLVSVLTRRDNQWRGREHKRQVLWYTLSIVTAFTLAHSVTLTATALGIIDLPSRWVEVGIAATVVFAALNNVFALVVRIGWLTFGFGLLHGMGFAGVLGELGLPPEGRVSAVLGFNLGVELGQIAIIMVVLPALVLCRKALWYRRWAMPAGSLAIALLGVQWLIERV